MENIEIIKNWKQKHPKEVNAKNAVLVLLDENMINVFVVREVNEDKLGFPGGRIENEDKTLLDAVLREFREETGIGVNINSHVKWKECLMWKPTSTVFMFAILRYPLYNGSIFMNTIPLYGSDGEISEMGWMDVDMLLFTRQGVSNLRRAAKECNPLIIKYYFDKFN